MIELTCLAAAWSISTFVAVTALREQMYFRGGERFYLVFAGLIALVASAASAFRLVQSLMT